MKLFVLSLLLLASIQALANPLILQPDISPNGSTIAFSYQGDIWTVNSAGGRAHRLTIHEGYESRPVWSNDSSQIAFSSDRFGNDDVYVMPKDGGIPKRLTYHSAHDRVTSFTENNQVLFNSRRTYAQVEREWEILSVDADVAANASKTESRFMDALGFDAVMSPNGAKVAFVRGTARTSREDYRGPANRNIWIYDITKNTYSQLTTFNGNDFMPKWIDNNSLYFISPRSGKYNIHKTDLDGEIEQITKETAFGINHFSTTINGTTLVYQAGNNVTLFDPKNSSAIPLIIDVKSDFRFDPVVAKSMSNKVDEYAVSPNGKLSAYVLRGDIYVTRNDKDDERSLALSSGPARDRDIAWLSDEALVFVSDMEGQNDLYLLKSSDPKKANLFASLKHKSTKLTSSEQEEFDPVVSPNGKQIAFRQDRGRLLVADIAADGQLSNQKALLDGWDTPSKVSWSPDSMWLAYSLSDLNFNEEVYIHPANNESAAVNISMHPKYDSDPIWSPDGSKLGFVSMRNNGDFDIWFAWLTKKDWQRSKEEWRRLDKEDDSASKEDKDESPDTKKDDDKSNKKITPEPIKIDFDGIYQRLEQVTSFAGNETQMIFDKEGENVYYSTGSPGRQNFKVERNLYKIKWNGEDKETLIGGNKIPSQLSLEESGKHLFTLVDGGKIMSIATKDDKAETLNVSSNIKIDYAQERAQVFDEGWRALNAGFYDPKFHGYDWDALRTKYRPLALAASTKEDFQYIFNLMLGQLNASHMGMRSGENPKQTQSQKTGLLGIEGFHSSAGYEITSVLANSPADREDSKLSSGDVIVSVNQQSLTNHNLFALLNDTVNSPVLLEIANKDETKEVVIWPTSSLSSQLYDAWVDERRKLTNTFSKGKLGYLHIRGMNWSSFERFERELMAAGYGKDGIVIDVRYNGGGWTTDYLMAVLNVKQHSYTIPRGATSDIKKNHRQFKDTYPFAERLPLSAWTKPSIAMSNENSYSNAEIFSHAYKALGIGKLVGRPTFGAVISTGGYGLVDGSFVRMPFRGWWVKETGENMERVPARPDIEVFNPPAYKAKGVDPQLQRAVKELLKDI
ncbi:MAG: C-terminal processing protease CtpA/Prc/Tol biopolymer transport system component [Alphaproteobacteria bacterium]|jgi:C-terminal processing protease CtpA/Prc/Tol biopolymer transport system component